MSEPDRRSPLLQIPGAVAVAAGPDAGVASHYGDPMAEQRALAAGRAFVDLSHRDVLAVAGPDRLGWLDTVSSQRLRELAPGVSVELLVLDPHGRVEHAAAAVDDGDSVWLVTEPGRGARLLEYLDSMRFTLRVEVTDASARVAALGAIGPGLDALAALTERTRVALWRDPWPGVTAGGARYGSEDHPGRARPVGLVLIPRDELGAIAEQATAAGLVPAGSWADEALRIAAWRPRLTREVDDRTLPHELDWLRTAVHLDKGCYRGQEAVARVINLGRPPRRLVKLHLDGSEHLLPEPGARVIAAGRDVGVLTSVARHWEEGPIGLAVVKRGLAEDAELGVGGVAAAQEVVVPAHGQAADRIAPPRPELAPLRRRAR